MSEASSYQHQQPAIPLNHAARGTGSGHEPSSPALDFSGLDGDASNDIAVCGFSIKFPQEATSSDGFWKMMVEKRCAMTDFPAHRMRGDGFRRDKPGANTIPVRGGHFFQEDTSVFDADFFSISPAEAAAMDPMQRWLLEAAYRALENAGMSMESVSNSMTGVYTGSFSVDYMLQLARDPECSPMYAAVGFGLSMLANRLSWFYNLRGPSVALDSACSATGMGTDIACQALRNGSCDMAMVAGCNIATAPEAYVWMSNISFLSPDSRCHSFDHRGNGYARGEGLGVMILKRVSDAIRDGNTIRAVIRATGSNEDGKTPGVTQPSREAQERLIRETYRRAGLSMAHTRFFEAHGTGTAIGDPREAQAIGSAFRDSRSAQDPLYVGAVKSNIGHLEGASCLAGIVKAVLVLERGIIPPNTNFEKLNPKIDAEFLRLKFPVESHAWPTSGLRRASVNSFGFGGANAHIVLDDAYNYLRLRSLPGRHATKIVPCLPATAESSPATVFGNGRLGQKNIQQQTPAPKLLVWSAADKRGIQRIVDAYRDWWSGRTKPDSGLRCDEDADGDILADLAFTLGNHRSHLLWRSWAVVDSPTELSNLQEHVSAPIRSSPDAPRLGFVFTGQGAQWFAMGRELMRFDSFRAELIRAGCYLKGLGCSWSVMDELQKEKAVSRVGEPELSQPLCTILQVALVNLLQRFGVGPSAVVGHSSGEIAAAYAGGYLDSESAWKLAYFRGYCCAELSRSCEPGPDGAMISVGLPEDRARELVGLINPNAAAYGLTVGCINSPSNVTVSGEEELIDQLKAQLDEQKVFARKLHVSLAYHSRQMEAIRVRYTSLVGALSSDGDDAPRRPCVPMVSSVTGERIAASQLTDPSYWALNMVSPVQFSKALMTVCAQSHTALVKKIDRSNRFAVVVDHLVEVGPHAALQGPIRETLRQIPRGKSLGYTSILRRGESAASCTLRALGELYCLGVPVALREANEPQQGGIETNGDLPSPSLLTSLPEYPFDHSQQFWHEGRLSRNYRLRPHAPSELLGVRDRDWNASEARWQHFIRFSEMPWVEQHVINGTVLYPGTGMLGMAVEAARQLVEGDGHGEIESYTLRDVHFEGAMALSSGSTGTEVQTCLRRVNAPARSSGELTFEFTIRTPPADQKSDEWTLNCRGFVSTELCVPEEEATGWEKAKTAALRQKTAQSLSDLTASCGRPVPPYRMYRFLRECGYDYGSDFQLAHDQRCHGERKEATAEVQLFQDKHGEDHVFHPTSLDAIMHICFTAFSLGGTVPMATSIPSHISRMWISSRGLRWRPDQQSVTACIAINTPLRRGFAATGGALARGSGELSLWYEGLELTSVTQAPALPPLPNPKQWYMNSECKVAVDKLTKSDVVDLLGHLHQPEEEDISPFFQDLERLVRLSLELLRHAVEGDPDFMLGPRGSSWKAQYWNWAQYQLASTSHGRQNQCPWSAKEAARIETKQQELQSLMDRLGKVNQVGRVYSQVAANLIAMFNGDVEPLELLIHSGLLKEYYQELAGYRCSRQVATYMDLMAHQAPGMTILEVGGGTGSATRSFVRALRSGGQEGSDAVLTQPGSLRCKRYDFTDISSVMVEGVQEEFAPFSEQMTFGVFDIENDLAGQGFEENAYDVVVADNVLHATADLRGTLRNIRKALKPGGRLLMHEPLKQSGGLLGFVFGLFGGWWLGSGDGRALSPSITPEAWHAVLRETGFSGTDMVLRDFDDDVSHHVGWVVATAVGSREHPGLNGINGTHSKSRQTHRTTIMVDGSSQGQVALAEKLHPQLHDRLDMETIRVLGIDMAGVGVTDSLVILLVDFEKPFLSSLDENSWGRLTYLFRTCRRLLWISSNGGSGGGNPDQGLIDGLARSLRAEYYELHLVTLSLDPSSKGRDAASLVSRVAEEMMSRAARQPYEQEYVEIQGRLHTRRLVEARGLKLAMDAKLTPHDVVRTPLDGSSYFEVSTASPGVGSATDKFFVRCGPPALPEAEDDDVSIAVRAVLLQTQHRAAALGQDHDPSSAGYYCAGVVASSKADAAFQPGDRVLAVCHGPLGSHVRVASRLVAKVPPQLPFTDACARAPFLMAAHKALVEVCRVEQEDSVLVRNGSSPAGQAALLLLKKAGVRQIWTTAADEQESIWISSHLGIQDDSIMPEAWFANRPMISSQSQPKFDVVLSQDDGGLSSSSAPGSILMDCVRSGGRYVQLRTGTASHSNTQRISSAPPSISVHTLDMAEVAGGRHVQSAIDFAATHAVALTTDSVHVNAQHKADRFPASDFANAFKRLDKSEGESVIIEFKPADTVDVRVLKQPAYNLDPSASYLIAGGLGGIGRTMARWLVSRGARYLILLSRSGPKTAEARQLVRDLNGQGVCVETPLCDVTNARTLRSVLDDFAERMPPVKGCIQSVMVVTELILEKMTFHDWEAAVDPKVRGSWNLQQELPRSLDFFILISSMMGTIGGGSLSAYSAANSYMDSLARYMVAQGRRAAALALGIVPDSGWLTEHSERLDAVEGQRRYAFTLSAEIIALLDIFCDPTNPLLCDPIGCHAVLGVRPPAHWAHVEDVPFTMDQPLWGHMHHVPALSDGGADQDADTVKARRAGALDAAERLTKATSRAEAAEIASEALAQRISSLLGTTVDRLEPQKPMHSYGIDSLSAIEVRNWVAQIFDVDLPVFDILGGATLASAGMSIAQKHLGEEKPV